MITRSRSRNFLAATTPSDQGPTGSHRSGGGQEPKRHISTGVLQLLDLLDLGGLGGIRLVTLIALISIPVVAVIGRDEKLDGLVGRDLGFGAVGEGDGYGAVLADSDLGVVGQIRVGFLDLVLDLVLFLGGEVVRVDDAGDFGVVDLGLLVVLELADGLVRSDRGC